MICSAPSGHPSPGIIPPASGITPARGPPPAQASPPLSDHPLLRDLPRSGITAPSSAPRDPRPRGTLPTAPARPAGDPDSVSAHPRLPPRPLTAEPLTAEPLTAGAGGAALGAAAQGAAARHVGAQVVLPHHPHGAALLPPQLQNLLRAEHRGGEDRPAMAGTYGDQRPRGRDCRGACAGRGAGSPRGERPQPRGGKRAGGAG